MNIRSILPIDERFKLSPLLTKEKFPDWAMSGEDILLNLKYFSKEDRATLIDFIAENKGKVIDQLDKVNILFIQYPSTAIDELVKNPLIQWVEPVSAPNTPHSRDGLSTTRSNALNTDYGGGRKYDGSGVVVGLSDDGRVGPHIDLQGRVKQFTIEDDGIHGDMTSGIIAGAGNLDPTKKAMAPGVDINIYRNPQSIFLTGQTHITEALDNYNNLGTIITSTSFGGVGNSEYNANSCLLYTSPSPRDQRGSRMPSSA